MKRMCAWCGREMDQVECRENQPLTHGLCPECRRRFFAVVKGQDARSVENDEAKAQADPPLSERK